MTIAFKINDSNLPEFSLVDTGETFMVQHCWPDGIKWDSVEQATAWAEAYVEQVNNPKSKLVAGIAYPNVTIARKEAEEYSNAIIEASEQARLALEAENAEKYPVLEVEAEVTSEEPVVE